MVTLPESSEQYLKFKELNTEHYRISRGSSRYYSEETDSASSSFSSFSSSTSSEFDSTEFENNNSWNFIEGDILHPTLLQTEMESIQVVEGYLDRKEESGLFPKWMKSFCRICGTKMFFSDENLIVIDFIDLLQVKQVHWGSTKSLKFSVEDYSGHKYSLRADNEALKLYWTVKIRSVARYLQKELSSTTSKSERPCTLLKDLLSVS